MEILTRRLKKTLSQKGIKSTTYMINNISHTIDLSGINHAINFLKHHGKKVVITSINNIEKSMNGKSGTIIRK